MKRAKTSSQRRPAAAAPPGPPTAHRATPGMGAPVLAASALLVISGAAFWTAFGRYYPDEPFYLYCGRLALQGRLPYRDFLFTQTPLVLYPYGAVAQFVSAAVWPARGLSGVLLGACGILCAALATRLAGKLAGILTALLLVTNSFAMYHLVLAKGYSFGALLLCLGVVVLLCGRPGPQRAAVGGLLLASAALVRATVATVLPGAWGWLLLHRRGRDSLALALSAFAVLAAGLLPFALPAPRAFWFGIWGYHRAGLLDNPDPVMDWLVRYAPVWIVLASMAAAAALSGGREALARTFGGPAAPGWLAGLVGWLLAVHLAAGARRAEYHALYYPLACALLAVWAGRCWGALRGIAARCIWCGGVGCACLVGLLLTAPEASWIAGGYYPQPPPAVIAAVRSGAGEGEPVLCLHPEVFLLSSRDGVAGTEMGVFALTYDARRAGPPAVPLFGPGDFLACVRRREVPVVVLREADLDYLEASWRARGGAGSVAPLLRGALDSGYRRVLATGGSEEGRPHHMWEVWQRAEANLPSEPAGRARRRTAGERGDARSVPSSPAASR